MSACAAVVVVALCCATVDGPAAPQTRAFAQGVCHRLSMPCSPKRGAHSLHWPRAPADAACPAERAVRMQSHCLDAVADEVSCRSALHLTVCIASNGMGMFVCDVLAVCMCVCMVGVRGARSIGFEPHVVADGQLVAISPNDLLHSSSHPLVVFTNTDAFVERPFVAMPGSWLPSMCSAPSHTPGNAPTEVVRLKDAGEITRAVELAEEVADCHPNTHQAASVLAFAGTRRGGVRVCGNSALTLPVCRQRKCGWPTVSMTP